MGLFHHEVGCGNEDSNAMIRYLKGRLMKIMGMPSCQEIESFAYAFLEDQLEPGLRRKFELHLKGCRDCKKFVKTYKEVAHPENLAGEVELDPEFEKRVYEFLRLN